MTDDITLEADENGTVAITVEAIDGHPTLHLETYTVGSDVDDSVQDRVDGVVISGLEPGEKVAIRKDD